MTKERAEQLRAIIGSAMQSVDDAKAMQALAYFPEWHPGDNMAPGKRVRHEGVLYRVLEGHIATDELRPDDTPNLFQQVLLPFDVDSIDPA